MTNGLAPRLRRVADNAFALLSTHIRLAGLEWQDEVERILRYLALLAVAVVCGSIGLVLLALLVVVLYWDTHRVAAMLVLASAFMLSAALLVLGLWRALRVAALPFARLAEEVERNRLLFAAEVGADAEAEAEAEAEAQSEDERG
ncbi:MAG TPA: phage holin family protein [Rhodocyclaceae bacterium]|nr:phage holin family protein [Rhodocyclaceae bacterium]